MHTHTLYNYYFNLIVWTTISAQCDFFALVHVLTALVQLQLWSWHSAEIVVAPGSADLLGYQHLLMVELVGDACCRCYATQHTH